MARRNGPRAQRLKYDKAGQSKVRLAGRTFAPRATRPFRWAASAVALLSVLTACDLLITVGGLGSSNTNDAGAADAANVRDVSTVDAHASDAGSDAGLPFPIPFAAGFDNADGGCGFFEFAWPTAVCYTSGGGINSVVTSLAHTGKCAAAFTTVADAGCDARCYVQGRLAVPVVWFAAWFYIPSPPPTLDSRAGGSSWNVMHFVSSTADAGLSGILDVNFVYVANGAVAAVMYDYVGGNGLQARTPTPLPLNQWFKLSLRSVRSAGDAGALTLYQDGTPIVDAEGIETAPGPFLQFYVGNLTNKVTVPTATLYVDDVSVSTSGP